MSSSQHLRTEMESEHCLICQDCGKNAAYYIWHPAIHQSWSQEKGIHWLESPATVICEECSKQARYGITRLPTHDFYPPYLTKL